MKQIAFYLFGGYGRTSRHGRMESNRERVCRKGIKVHDQKSRWADPGQNASEDEISRRWASTEIVQKEKQASRVKRTASTINSQRLRLTADLFIRAASIDGFSQSLSIKVLDGHTERGEKRKRKPSPNKQDRLKGVFFPIVFRLFLGRPLFCFDVMSGCWTRRVCGLARRKAKSKDSFSPHRPKEKRASKVTKN